MVKKGFTLVELLVTISIIAILVTVSIFGLTGARELSRDSRRKSDLELIKAGLELYRADCNAYPLTLPASGSSLVGTYPGSGLATCLATNSYISVIPGDPSGASKIYKYSTVSNGYELCTSLEQQGLSSVTCGGSSDCGNGATCNYKITNP
jgi:prepilin-type N-terminal cleavage/methylation domain-containing protein